MSRTGRRLVSGEVAGPSCWIRAASTIADGDGDDGQDARVTGVVGDRGVLDADELLVGGRQVGVDGDRDQHQGDHGGDEEPRLMAVMPLRSERRGATANKMPIIAVDDADRGDDQREGEAQVAEGGLAEDERGHQGDGVGLEEVGRHSGGSLRRCRPRCRRWSRHCAGRPPE